MASQKLISNGYISVAQLNSVPPSAADLDMLGFTLLERNLILQTLKPPTEPTPEIESLKRKLEQVEETAKKYEQEVQALRQEVEVIKVAKRGQPSPRGKANKETEEGVHTPGVQPPPPRPPCIPKSPSRTHHGNSSTSIAYQPSGRKSQPQIEGYWPDSPARKAQEFFL
eukprot:TRINITY_DN330_c0_g1_i31.p1 TRINITY_DN330_c0_g1~~TRINITY_DN330_c0_g1_i31.p1  ORF type:complete len:169 (-),score=34.84 TRINITY_DN330_c0_g1_i31:336-842(-)